MTQKQSEPPHSHCPKQDPESHGAHFAENNTLRVQGFVPLAGSLLNYGQIDVAMTLIIGFQHGISLLCAQLELIVFDQHLIHG